MISDLAYGDAPSDDTDLAYSDNTPAGPHLPDNVLNARVGRADFALGDKSPGPDVLKDAFASGNERQVRLAAAGQADAEFRQDKLKAIQKIASQGTPVTDTEVNGIMAIGQTPEANPDTVLEDKFAKNFVNAGIIGDPEKNTVFQSAYETVPERTQKATLYATGVITRNHIVKGVLEEAEAAYKTVPWFDQDGQKGVVGDGALGILTGGISSAVIQRNLLNDQPGNSFLPGKNKLEQIQYLYLLPHDQMRPALMAAAGPGSDMWKEHPKEALDFIKAATQYSASDAYVDNVMGVTNIAAMLPFGSMVKTIGLMRGGKEVEQVGVQALETARNVLKESPKAPVTPGKSAFDTAQDVLSGSSKPPTPGYYLPEAAVKRPWEAEPRIGNMSVKNGVPSVQTEDGADVVLSRTPEVGHYPLNVSEGQPTTTFQTSRGSSYTVQKDGTTIRDKAGGHSDGQSGIQPASEKTIYVDSKQLNQLSEFQAEGGPRKWLDQHQDGRWGILYRDGKDAGKYEKRTMVSPKYEPEKGLYPVEIWDNGEKVHFGNKITNVSTNVDQKVTLGPQIVAREEIEARKALADIAKAPAEPDVVDALSKMGQHEQAATIQAERNLQSRFDDVVKLGDPEVIRQNVPSLASPQLYYHNSMSLSAERARRLADEAIQTSSEIGAAILDPVRVERMTADALNRSIDAAKTVVATKYNRASNSILDQATVWDGASNTYSVQTKFGKRDGSLFDSSAAANFARTMDYRLGTSATVEQEGNKFYLSHIQHVDETQRGVRDSLIVSGNETPRGMFNAIFTAVTGKINPLGNSLRSSAYTVSPFQRNNRVVATHASSILKDVIEDTAGAIKDLGTWTSKERQEMQEILEHNRDYMQPDGQRGQFYKSALEFETAFQDKFGKLPTEKQVVAYDNFTRLSDLDWVLRELDWHRDKVRQGVRNYRVSFSKADETGIPQKGKTDWFNAKKVENFDPVNTQDANIYVMPEGRFQTKFGLKKDTVEDLLTQKKIKEGQYEILQVYNPGSKPLAEATGIKDNIHFVVVDKYEDKALQMGENSVYRPGGHVIYQDNHFMKQPQIGTGTLGRLTHYGDTTVKSFATPKEGQMFVDRYNTARELLHKGDEAGLKAYIDAGNLPETLPEFKKLFTEGGASLSTEHPFVLTTTGRSTFQSSEELARAYPGLKDTFSSYDLTQTGDHAFLAERDKQLNTVANIGTEEHPIYSNVPSRLYDPYTALQKGLGQIVRQRWMGDYKISAAESWVQEFGLLFDQSKLPLDKLRQNPVYWLSHAEGNLDLGVARTNPELMAAAMTSRKNILNFIGARDEVGAMVDGITRKLIEKTESIGGKYLAQKVEESWLPAITNAPAYARASAFHAVIGLFNPVQLFQQAQGLTHALALSPVNGLKGTTASALARLYRYTENADILDSMANKATALGWNKEHFVEAYSAWKNSGTHNIGGEAALLNQVQDPQLFKNGAQTFLDKGTIFFKMGESIVRDTSFFTAYADWRAANPTLKLDNRAMGDISRRFDTLSMNMTRASNAAYNEGILSPATQFWTWNARFTEQMLSGGLTSKGQLTLGEKARAFAMYSTMYGIPATLGGVTFGLIPYANYNDIRQYALSHNINVSDKYYQTLSEGLPAMLTNTLTGHNTDFQRFGPSATQAKDIIDGKKDMFETLGGASAGFVRQIMGTVYPAFMYGFSAFKKDSEFPLKWNDLINLAENVSSFNNGEKAYIALTTGKNMSKKSGAVDNHVDTFEGFMLALGLNPKRDSDAYQKIDYLKAQKTAQDKLAKNMQEDWKIGMSAGMRGDFQTMSDYMKRVHAWSTMGDFTKQQEIEQFQKASRLNEDLVTGADRQFRQNVKALQSIPALKQYLENQKNK